LRSNGTCVRGEVDPATGSLLVEIPDRGTPAKWLNAYMTLKNAASALETDPVTRPTCSTPSKTARAQAEYFAPTWKFRGPDAGLPIAPVKDKKTTTPSMRTGRRHRHFHYAQRTSSRRIATHGGPNFARAASIILGKTSRRICAAARPQHARRPDPANTDDHQAFTAGPAAGSAAAGRRNCDLLGSSPISRAGGAIVVAQGAASEMLRAGAGETRGIVAVTFSRDRGGPMCRTA